MWRKNKNCGEITKYDCISCGEDEPNEDVPGWQQFKSVSYCMSCKQDLSDFGNRESDCGQQSKCSSSCSASTLESPRSQSPFESLNENASGDQKVI